MNDLVISNVVICDDIRKEMSGKDLLIGVYSSSITMSALPGHIGIAIWLEIIPKKIGNLIFEMRLEIPDNHPQPHMRIEADVKNLEDSFSVFTPQLPIFITKEGDLKLSIRPQGQDRWRPLKKVKLIYQSPSIVQQNL